MGADPTAGEVVRPVVAVQHATGDHGGKRLDITGCQFVTVEARKIREVRGHYSDQYALDDFWSWRGPAEAGCLRLARAVAPLDAR